MQKRENNSVCVFLNQLMQWIWMPLILLLLFCFVFYQEGSAQEGKNLNSSVQIDDIVVSKFPEIYAVVSAKSEKGQTVRELNPDNFLVTTKENIQSFNHPKTVLPIVKAKLEEPILYITTFINGHKSIEHFKEDICNGIKNTLSQAGFMIDIGVTSQSTLQTSTSSVSFTHDSSKICQSIQTLGILKESVFYEKLQKSIEETRGYAGYKCGAVVIITTHDDDNFRENAHELERCIRTAKEKDVPVYVIWINTLLCTCEKNGMKKLTLDTGGKYFEYEKKKGIKAPFAEIVRNVSEKYLRNQYAIVFDDPDIEPEKRFHTYTIGVRTHDKGEIKYATLKPIEIPEGLIRKNRADIDLKKGVQELKNGQYPLAISTFRSVLPNIKLLAGIANYQENALKLQDGILDGLRQILNKTTDLIKEGNFEKAEDLLNGLNKHVAEDGITAQSSARITKEEVGSLSRLFFAERGIRLKNSGKLSDAEADLSMAIEGQEPSSSDTLGKAVRIGLCEIYSKNGEYDKVIQRGEEIQKVFANENLSQVNTLVSAAYHQKAEEQANSKNYSQAVSYMRKSIDSISSQSEKDLIQLGEYALLSSDYKMAVEVCEDIVNKNQDKDAEDARVSKNLSKAYLGNCQFDSARDNLMKLLQENIGDKEAWEFLISAVQAKPLRVFCRLLAHHATQFPEQLIYEHFTQLKKRQTRLSDDILGLDIIDVVGNSLVHEDKERKNYFEMYPDLKSNFLLDGEREKLFCSFKESEENKGYCESHFFVPISYKDEGKAGFIALTFNSSLSEGAAIKLKSYKDKQVPVSDIISFLDTNLGFGLYKSNGLVMAELTGDMIKNGGMTDEHISPYNKIFLDDGNTDYFILTMSKPEEKIYVQPDEFERKEEIFGVKDFGRAIVFGFNKKVGDEFIYYDFMIPVYISNEWKGVFYYGIKMAKCNVEK